MPSKFIICFYPQLEIEDMKRKFQAALLLGKVEETAVVHFLQKNPKAPQLTDEIIKVSQDLKKCELIISSN